MQIYSLARHRRRVVGATVTVYAGALLCVASGVAVWLLVR